MDSVRNALALLEAVAQSPGIGVSELARRLGMPKSTAQRGLRALSAGGWVSRGVDRRDGWLAGTRLFALARLAEPAPGLRRAALPHMRALRDATGETIHLMAPDGGEVVLIERLDSTQPLRTVRQLGGRVPLHVASNGKAVLAALPAAEQEAYLAAPLFPSSRLSITDPDRLRADLAEVRAYGFAVSRGELDDGINAVAAAVLRSDGRPIGSLSISCPAARLTEARIPEYGAMVAEAARLIARDAALLALSAP